MSQIHRSRQQSLRCQRHRKRSQRRKIFCPEHGCYLDSVSPKRRLFADRAEQLQQRGMGRKSARLLVAQDTTVPLTDEWLEAFWCDQCQSTRWYHVGHEGAGAYTVTLAPMELWRQVTGVIDPAGNPSVGEFTRRSARMGSYRSREPFGWAQ